MDKRAFATVDDGFDKPIKQSERVETGDPKPSSGDQEPKRAPETIAGFATVSPFDIDGGTSDGSPAGGTGDQPRRRTRSGPRKTETKTANNLTGDLEGLLLAVHFGVSRLLELKELELSEDQARRYSDNIKAVAKFYPVTFNAKYVAWGMLLVTMAEVYGTAWIAISNRQETTPASAPVSQPTSKTEPTPINRKPASTPVTVSLVEKTPHELWNEAPTGDYSSY